MSAEIRPFQPGDIGWVISAHEKEYSKEFGFDYRFELDIARKSVSLFEKYKNVQFWVAEVSGERAGSIVVSKISEKVGFINFLLVLPPFRQNGIAGNLLSLVTGYARQEKLSVLRLETYSCLTTARDMYRRIGFEPKKVIQGVLMYGKTFDQEFWELSL